MANLSTAKLSAQACLANSLWWLASAKAFFDFTAALHDPAKAQEQILRQHVARNAQTAFGREHGFADIRTPQQFAQRVPARDYDQMRPWIDRICRGEQRVLTAEPVSRLIPTSGSTAARKLIPCTATLQRQLNRAIGPWIFDLYRRAPGALAGASYWSISPAIPDEVTSDDDCPLPIGFEDDAAYLGGFRKGLLNSIMAVAADVRHIGCIDAWRYATVLSLLRRRDLSLISIWHPSFLTLLLDAMRRDWDRLLRDIATGDCTTPTPLPPDLKAALRSRPNPSRAAELHRTGPLAIHRIWPRLKIVSCWVDGHAAPAAAELAQRMPSITLQPKGLIATEGIISIPFAGVHPLAIRSHFFEFEDETARFLLASDLQPGKIYNVILTTASGLCRYRLNDQVRITSFLGRTPTLRFVGKSSLVSDRMGEKLSDGFVAGVLDQLFQRRPRTFALLAPDLTRDGCRYTLYVDASMPPESSEQLDALLCTNPHYAYCRRLGQLQPPRLFHISDAANETYLRRLYRAGHRLGDIKPAALSSLHDWSSHFCGDYVNTSPPLPHCTRSAYTFAPRGG